jgi:hypothetical protein
VKIVIQGEFPAMNEIIAASKSHFGQYSQMKKEYTQLVKLETISKMQKYKYPPMQGKVNVELTWYTKDEKKDPDNVAAGCKFILDGLRDSGIIKDDTRRYINALSHEFRTDKNNPRVEIELKGVS